jgi:hypothetical protein
VVLGSCEQVKIGGVNYDVAAKRHKNHKNKISHLIISIGYEIEIREF